MTGCVCFPRRKKEGGIYTKYSAISASKKDKSQARVTNFALAEYKVVAHGS